VFIQVDAKALEWMCALHLSGDAVGIKEWESNVDQHTVNQEAFNLPTRLIAKTFLFRLIYGGSAGSYAADPDFVHVSNDREFWQKVIDKTYSKYSGLKQWHDAILVEVMQRGYLTLPTGRRYYYQPVTKYGKTGWPRTQILNYPVQGLGAELMALARIRLFKKLGNDPEILFRATVHDSIVLDIPRSKQEETTDAIREVWRELPNIFERTYKSPWNLECRCEIAVGNDLKNLEEV